MSSINSRIQQINEEFPRAKYDKYEIVFNNGTKYYKVKEMGGKVYLLKYDDPSVEVVINSEDFKDE